MQNHGQCTTDILTSTFQTYEAFVKEAGLPFDAGNVSKGDLTLESLLDEKKTFDIAVKFEKLGVEDAESGWRKPGASASIFSDIRVDTDSTHSAEHCP